MNLLVITQKIDRNDPILGFFHNWIIAFSKHFKSLIVICLEKGDYDLPPNVKVLSLGKESYMSRGKYINNFYKIIWNERMEYDAVFVHMNQEYILLGGWLWCLMGKKVTMWRNHHAGNILTEIAAFFCTKTFCTSKYSFTAKYKKTVLMPVGIDLNRFKPVTGQGKKSHSILFLSRMAPVKKPDVFIDVLHMLSEKGVNYSASFYGDPLPKDKLFFESLKKKVNDFGLSDVVTFNTSVPNEETVAVYNSHEIFVNLSPSGMYDKTIFEAMACGCMVMVSNENLEGQIDPRFIFKESSMEDLVSKLQSLLNLLNTDKILFGLELRNFVLVNHSLDLLVKKLACEI